MAVTRINLSDPVSTLVTKTNTISGDLGDIAELYSGDSNTVDAINRLSLQPKVDSAQVQTIARASLSGTEVITYNTTTGVIGVDSAGIVSVARAGLSGSEAITYDTSTGVIGMDSSHFDDLIDSAIKNTITVSMTEGNGNYLAFSKATGILYSIDRFRGSTTIGHDSANRWFALNDSAVTTVKLDANAVTTAKINANAVTTAKLDDSAVTTAKLDVNAVTSDKLATSAVTSGKLATNAVTTVKINDNAVTTAKINASAVTSDKLATSAVTTVKINANAVTTAKLATDIPVTTFTNIGTLNILDSDGTTLHTLYKAT
jgi:hypothetical protein